MTHHHKSADSLKEIQLMLFKCAVCMKTQFFIKPTTPQYFDISQMALSASLCHKQQQRCLRTTPAWSCLKVLLNAQHSLRNEPVSCRVAPEWGISVVIGLKMKQKHGDLSWWAHPGRDELRWLPCLLEPSSQRITQTSRDRCFKNYTV